MSLTRHLLPLSFILTWTLSACIVSIDTDDPNSCVPGTSFDVNCNTCECPASGIKSFDNCTMLDCSPPDPCNVCAEQGLECVEEQCVIDLCAGVECPDTPGWCEGNVAYGGAAGSTCDSSTGECSVVPGAPPVDCDEWGEVCVEGFCTDLCQEVTCPGAEASCEDGVAYASQGEGICDAATGDCQYPPSQPPEECAALGLECLNGICMEKANLCDGVTCPGTDPFCEGDIAYSGTPESTCDPETGECLVPPVAPPQDCAADGLTCEDGICVKENTACGGIAGLMCKVEETCNITSCGADLMGTCVPNPGDCDAVYDPVCGCDGKTYSNDCERIGAGAALDYVGECDAPDACAPMDATGVGACAAFFGYAWNGESCAGISGCDCEGADCPFTFDSPEACEKTYAECGGPLLADACNDVALPDDPFQVIQAKIEDDTLHLLVQYGGGCKDHIFSACFGDIIPAGIDKVELNISHDANNDNCLALPITPLEIDLTTLKLEYLQIWEGPTGVLSLTVTGWPEPIFYEFQAP